MLETGIGHCLKPALVCHLQLSRLRAFAAIVSASSIVLMFCHSLVVLFDCVLTPLLGS
jgi:hypothetical protein